MKTVKVQGGLGNQLFCLAFAWSIARLTGEAAGLDVAGYGADRYGHRFALADLAERMGGLAMTSHPVLGHRLVGAVLRRLAMTAYVGESAAPRDLAALARLAARGAYFDGYWQDEAYMADLLSLRSLVRAFLDDQAPATARYDLVVHYRTYQEEIRPSRRATPDGAYFHRALAEIERRQGPVGEIVLVSDDVAVAMERLGDLPRPVTSVSGLVYADMGVMIRARNLILTNSSFSWWGGFCGDAQTVIYPVRGDLYHYPAPARRFVCL